MTTSRARKPSEQTIRNMTNRIYTTLLVLILAAVIGGCGSKEPVVHNPVTAEGGSVSVRDENGPKIEFKETEYDFGTVMQGERLSHTFVFTNTGKSDLIISSAHASCGCTTSTPPRAPIKPGETSEIKVTFDSKTKLGPTTNVVTVSANTYPTRTLLRVSADVKIP